MMEYIVNPQFIFKKKSILTNILLFLIFFLSPSVSNTAETAKIKTIVIIPFETNSQTDISYIRSGVLNMLHSRLSWNGNIKIIKKDVIVNALSLTEQSTQNKTVFEFGQKSNADYIITGTITHFSGAYSIDAKVYDLKKKSFFIFFDQSKTINKLISKTDVIAAKINKKIFDRSTVSYEKYKNEQIISEDELKRMNPERMIPVLQSIDGEEKPWWKVW